MSILEGLGDPVKQYEEGDFKEVKKSISPFDFINDIHHNKNTRVDLTTSTVPLKFVQHTAIVWEMLLKHLANVLTNG